MADKKVTVVLTAKDRASKAFKEVGGALKTSVIAGAIAATAALGALSFALVKATRASIEFQKGIAEIKALGVEKSIKEISAEVFSLTKQFGTKPQAAISAYYDAISAGVKESKVLEFLGEASKLALAGATDVSIATDILTGLRETFQETDASLAATVNSVKNFGKTTVEQLQKIGSVAPIAAELGLNFQELGASVATATIVIGNTEQTLTGLKAAFTAVLKPGAEAVEVADRLGIDFSSAAVATKGWVGFLADLSEKTKGNANDLIKLFGSVEAFNVVTVLAKDNAQGLADTFAGIREEIETGALQKGADIMKETAAVRLDILRAEIDAVVQSLTLQFLPAITDVAKGLVDIIKLKTGDVFKQEFAPGIEEAGAKVRQLEDRINDLSNSFGANIAQQTGTQQKLERLKGELAEANLEFRRAALGATDFDDRLVTLANRLIAEGQPAVAAYDGALRQLRGQLLLEKEGADEVAEAERKAAEARLAAAEAARRQALTALEALPVGMGFEMDTPAQIEAAEKAIEIQRNALQQIQDLNFEASESKRAILERDLEFQLEMFEKQLEFEGVSIEERLALKEFEAERRKEIDEEVDEHNRELALENLNFGQELAIESVETLTGGLATFIEHAILNAEDLKAVGEGVMRSLVGSVVGGLAKIASQFLVNAILNRVAKKQEGASTLSANLAGVFSGAFASTAAIPIIGPVLAPGVASAALTAATVGSTAAGAIGAGIGSGLVAQEGGFVPMLPGANANQDSVMAMLQPGELIVPTPFAQEFGRAQGFQEGGVVGGDPGAAPAGGIMQVVQTFVGVDPAQMVEVADALSEAVERFGVRLVSSEVAA